MKNYFTVFVVFAFFFISCKKDKKESKNTACELNVAPCTIEEFPYDEYEIFHYPSDTFPQAKYRIQFTDTVFNGQNSKQFAFNKEPETGMYQVVTFLDSTDQAPPHQIAWTTTSGSFLARSANIPGANVYIENSNNNLIISYCDIADNHFYFDDTLNAFIGISPTKLKVKMTY